MCQETSANSKVSNNVDVPLEEIIRHLVWVNNWGLQINWNPIVFVGGNQLSKRDGWKKIT